MNVLRKALSPFLLTILMAAAIALFLILPGTSETQTTPDWSATAARILDGTIEGPVPNPVPASTNPRRTAAVMGFLISILLWLLYRYRRRRYIAEWAGAWMLLACSALTLSRGYATADQARLALAVLVLSRIAVRLLMFRSAHSFNRTLPYSSKYWLIVPVVMIWILAATDRLGAAIVLSPIYLLSGIIDLRTASLFLRSFRTHRTVGAFILSASMAFIGLTNIGFGFFVGPVVSSGNLFLFFLTSNSMCFLIAAFGMHLLIFEETAYELRAANLELRAAHEELRRMAAVDPLTGCHNRRFFEENIDREMQRHRRYRTPLSLLFIDIDRFKNVNDSYGHDVGDRVLQYVGHFLMRQFREADYVVRWGGDEFLVLMTCTELDAVAKVNALKLAFDAAFDSNSLPPGLSLSIGYAEIPHDAIDILPFIRVADQNMYAQKALP